MSVQSSQDTVRQVNAADRRAVGGSTSPNPAQSRIAQVRQHSLLRSTLWALVHPRRLVPILLVGTPLVVAQVRLSSHPLAGPLGLVMCLTFFLLAPVSWRALFPGDEPKARPFAAPFGRLAVYGLAGAGTVMTVGVIIPREFEIPKTLMTSDVSLLVSIALFWVGGYGLGRDIDMESSLEAARAEAKSFAQEAERAQLLALRTHLDPHFLFNTLNAIAEWCREDGAIAERATLALSDMLRTVLEAAQAPCWPLSRELGLLWTLLDLHLIRDPALFELRRELCTPLPHVEVPPMILLPLVENAVKHGPSAGHRGALIIRVSVEDSDVVFEVDNPGEYRGPRPGGEGLPMVVKRLEHAYGGRASVQIAGHSGRTCARVTVPLDLPRPKVKA